jgi:hypothetical protein
MKQLYAGIIIALFVSTSLQAQNAKPDASIKGLIVSTNLVSLREPDGGVSLALEYRYSKNWSLLAEGTWIFIDEKEDYNLKGRYTPMAKGFRIRPEIRYYLPGKKGTYKMFFAQEISYKRVSYLEEWIEAVRETPNTGTVDYEKITAYRKTKAMYGTSGKFGFQVFFDQQRRCMFELYIGLGLKYRDVSFKDNTPPAGSYMEANYSYTAEEPKTGWDINVPMGLKLGYRF